MTVAQHRGFLDHTKIKININDKSLLFINRLFYLYFLIFLLKKDNNEVCLKNRNSIIIMLKKIFKIIILLMLMTLSKIIFIISVQVSEGSFHLEIKGFLAFLLVDIFLLGIIHSKKLMFLELMTLIIMVVCGFSGNELSIIMANILFIIVNIYILLKTWHWSYNKNK